MNEKPQPPSLRSIAKLAGVSVATVSLALRKSPRLLASTVARVESIAQQVGYRRNPELSRVMSETVGSRYRQTGETITCVVSRSGTTLESISVPFRAMKERAASYGYALESFHLFEDGRSAARANQILWARGTAGLVVLPPPFRLRKDGKITLPIEWNKFCVVELDDVMTEPHLNRVRHNHLGGIWRALEELEILGYRRIGLCLLNHVEFDTHHRWTAGYLYWSRIRGYNDLDPFIFREVSGNDVAKWIRRQRIDAVLAPGVEVLHWMRACGIRVPEEIGYASLDLFDSGAENATGIEQRRDVLWSKAIDLLVTSIHHGERGAPQHPTTSSSAGDWRPGATCRQLCATPLTRIEEGLIYPHGEPGARRAKKRKE